MTTNSELADGKKQGISVDVYWHSLRMGNLTRSNGKWCYIHSADVAIPFSNLKTREDGLPYFLESLLPEQMASIKVDLYGDRVLDGAQTRFLSSIQIVPEGASPSKLIFDVLNGYLDNFSYENRIFNGKIRGMPNRLTDKDNKDKFNPQIIDLIFDKRVPRTSGCQVKIPSYLDADGTLSPALDKPFTHIVKTPGITSNLEFITIAEYYGSVLAGLSNVAIENFALAKSQLGPLFIAERFDIPANGSEEKIYCEDMTAIMSISPKDKYSKDMIDVGKTLMEISTDPRRDAIELLRQCIASQLLVNTDLHAKNISILKRFNASGNEMISATLAPAYDMMCCGEITENQDMAMPLDGSRDYDFDNLWSLASVCNSTLRNKPIEKAELSSMMRDMALKIKNFAPLVAYDLSKSISINQKNMFLLHQTLKGINLRCDQMLGSLNAGIVPSQSPMRRYTVR